MPGRPPTSGSLIDRRRECAALDGLLDDVHAGRSRATVLRGEAGVGKSALLCYVTERAQDCHIATAAGVEWEMELAYSGLHQLCGPILDAKDELPAPQRDALATVFAESEGPPPERFLVGLATLSLLAVVAEEKPLICIIDDAQWLDRASAQILNFVGRRLVAERIGLLCAARTGLGDDILTGLPDQVIAGLGDRDARELLLASLDAPIDAEVSAQIVAESRGVPLALLELPRTWRTDELAGGFGLPGDRPVLSKIEQSYAERLSVLPPDTRLLLAAAAAEPLGDVMLLQRAATTLGVDLAAAGPAAAADLLRIGARVEFAHPLVRSIAYRSAPLEDQHAVHRALAAATDADIDPDRRAWHRARATAGPDEEIAAELHSSAARAQARGGVAAAAAFLHRAVALTVDPTLRAERALEAAATSLQAGAFDAARRVLDAAEAGPLDDLQRGFSTLLRGHVAFASGSFGEAPALLSAAAEQMIPLGADLAREPYLIAWVAAVFAGDHLGEDALPQICRDVRALPTADEPRGPLDLLLDGVAQLVSEGQAAAVPTLERAAAALVDLPLDDVLHWGWAATAASDAIWDNRTTRRIAERQAQLVRSVGALAQLPVVLAALGNSATLHGDFSGAAALIAEAEAIGLATGTRFAPYTALRLLAAQGRDAEATELITRTLEQAAEERQGLAAKNAHWASAVLANGRGRYQEAVTAAELAMAPPFEPFVSIWVLPELIEAAARSGDHGRARSALTELTSTTRPSGTEYGLGIEARCRALLHDGVADDLFVEAIDRLGRAGVVPDLARARLLYGEALRRDGRRTDARTQLRAAHEVCAEIGMEAFAERAARELGATGETVRNPSGRPRHELTPQEEQIGRLARDGLTNAAIGELLFLSPRTVEWHLRKVYVKLGISSRGDLRSSLPLVAGEASDH